MQIEPVKAVDATTKAAATADRQQQAPDNDAIPTAPETLKQSRFEAVSDDGKEIIYRAIDPETGILLAEVPSEEVRRVAQRLKQLIAEGKIE